MIRINLLPGARSQKRASSTSSPQGWFVSYGVAALLTAAILAFVYVRALGRLEEQQSANAALTREIRELESQSANIDEVRGQLERSRQLENVVSELQRARYGPTQVLMEISRILSVGGGPTVDPQRLEQLRRVNPLATYNVGWDPRRLWVTEFSEEDRSCNIKGAGKTNEDVAEFLRRLTLSDLFDQVALVQTRGAEDRDTHLPVIEFELNCRVNY